MCPWPLHSPPTTPSLLALPQKAAIAAARTTAKPAAGGRGRGRGRSSSRSPAPPRSKKGRKKDWASLMSWDESDTDDDWGPDPEPVVSASKAAALVRGARGAALDGGGASGWQRSWSLR